MFKFQYKHSSKKYGFYFFLSLIYSEFWKANVLWSMTPTRGIAWVSVRTRAASVCLKEQWCCRALSLPRHTLSHTQGRGRWDSEGGYQFTGDILKRRIKVVLYPLEESTHPLRLSVWVFFFSHFCVVGW